jgi:hypothetical protein
MTGKKTNILGTPTGGTVTLADGKAYKLSALDLNTLALMEDTFDCGLTSLLSKFEERMAGNMRKMLWVLLQKHQPQMTIEQVGELVTTDIMDSVMDELKAVLGA